MNRRALMWILWPSFLAAGVTSAAVFALIDPLDIAIFGHVRGSRQEVYTGAFFLFWIMGAVSSALSLYIVPRKPEIDDFGDIQ